MIHYCGEVVESSLTHVVCINWHEPCPVLFGNLVYITTEQTTLIGIVYDTTVASIQKDRLVHPFKKSIAELRRQQPQIFLFMHTYFSALLIGEQKVNGYQEGISIVPLLHANVACIDQKEYKKYIQGEFYIRIIYTHTSEFVRIQLFKKIFHYLQEINDAPQLHNYISTLLDISNNDIALIRAISE